MWSNALTSKETSDLSAEVSNWLVSRLDVRSSAMWSFSSSSKMTSGVMMCVCSDFPCNRPESEWTCKQRRILIRIAGWIYEWRCGSLQPKRWEISGIRNSSSLWNRNDVILHDNCENLICTVVSVRQQKASLTVPITQGVMVSSEKKVWNENCVDVSQNWILSCGSLFDKDKSTSVAIDGDVVVCHHVALFGLCCVIDQI